MEFSIGFFRLYGESLLVRFGSVCFVNSSDPYDRIENGANKFVAEEGEPDADESPTENGGENVRKPDADQPTENGIDDERGFYLAASVEAGFGDLVDSAEDLNADVNKEDRADSREDRFVFREDRHKRAVEEEGEQGKKDVKKEGDRDVTDVETVDVFMISRAAKATDQYRARRGDRRIDRGDVLRNGSNVDLCRYHGRSEHGDETRREGL